MFAIYYSAKNLCAEIVASFGSPECYTNANMEYSTNIQALRQAKLRCCLLVLVSLILANCGGALPANPVGQSTARFPTPTIAPMLAQPLSPVPVSVPPAASPISAVSSSVAAQGTVIHVDASQNVHPISPL